MKRITLGAVTILAISTLVILPLWHTDAEAGDSINGCKVQGVWIGESPYPLPGGSAYYNLMFFATFHGSGDNDGTGVINFINPVPDPGTVWSAAGARGVWAKSGPNTYDYSAVGYIYETGTGTILTIVKHRGTDTLTDCNTIVSTSTVEYVDANTMEPFLCVPLTVTLKRMLMHEACQPR
jgi:hypothetical protein